VLAFCLLVPAEGNAAPVVCGFPCRHGRFAAQKDDGRLTRRERRLLKASTSERHPLLTIREQGRASMPLFWIARLLQFFD
jgi:hypothetical protein